MARLLVSVRGPTEARTALAGGADVIDVKEPRRGPLGRADFPIWMVVRDVVEGRVPLSVALGELVEWREAPTVPAMAFQGIDYRKLGLAGAGWRWDRECSHLRAGLGKGPGWVMVAYADWEDVPGPPTPSPDEVLDYAVGSLCAGVLVDSWNKTGEGKRVDLSWAPWAARAKQAGLMVTLAGGLDAPRFGELAELRPDCFGVRGAACAQGRTSAIDQGRVVALAAAAHAVGPG